MKRFLGSRRAACVWGTPAQTVALRFLGWLQVRWPEDRIGFWACRTAVGVCGVWGHPWDKWRYDEDGSGCRLCSRCDAVEFVPLGTVSVLL